MSKSTIKNDDVVTDGAVSQMPVLDVRTAHSMCSSYLDDLNIARRNAAGRYYMNADNQPVFVLSTTYEDNLPGYESEIVVNAARVQVVLQRCSDPNSPLLQGARDAVDHVSKVYGADRLFRVVGTVREEIEAIAGMSLPVSNVVIPSKEESLGPLVIALYSVRQEFDKLRRVMAPVYSSMDVSFEVPSDEISFFPHPGVLAVVVTPQSSSPNYILSIRESLHGQKKFSDASKSLDEEIAKYGVQDDISSSWLQNNPKMEKYVEQWVLGFSRLAIDRPAQAYVQNVVKSLTSRLEQ